VIVSLPLQRAYVYRNGVLIGVTTVSTGAPGHGTPTGVFTVLQKKVMHRSNLYDSAPMPYMQRLTWGGIAMHAGHLPGYPASHGCIRMPMGFARQLYGVTRLGMTVVITDSDALPRLAPAPAVLRQGTASEQSAPAAGGGEWWWHPELAPSGPVSLVLSGADRRLLVLRNGVKIGSASVEIREPIRETRAYSLTKVDADGLHWMELPLPGQHWAGAAPEAAARPAKIPAEFESQLNAVLTPGATVVITPDSLSAGSTGRPITVVEAGPAGPGSAGHPRKDTRSGSATRPGSTDRPGSTSRPGSAGPGQAQRAP
jgi:hypothetical protein